MISRLKFLFFRYARLTEPPKVRNVFILLLSLFKKVNVAFSVFWIGFLGSSKIKKKKKFSYVVSLNLS